MSQPLPTHEFGFLQPGEIETLAVEVWELSDDAEVGYIFEVGEVQVVVQLSLVVVVVVLVVVVCDQCSATEYLAALAT